MRSSLPVRGLATVALVLLLAVSSALMSGPLARGSADALLDEGFESGVEDWAIAGGELLTTSTIAHQGAQSALFSAGIDGTGLIQYRPIPVRPEGAYSLTVFLFKDDPRVESITLRIGWEDENGAYIDWTRRPPKLDGDQQDWRSLTTDEPSPPDAAFAVIQVLVRSGEGGSFYLDDFKLEGPPPLPATATPSPTDTPEPSPTSSPSATSTPTRVPSPTPTATPSATPTARTGSSLVNGDFEEADGGVPTGWRKYGGDLWQTSRQCRSGRHSGELVSRTDSTKWAYQQIAVSGDTSYQFDSYVLLNDPAVKEVFLRISWYLSDDASGRAIAVSDSPQRLSGNDPSFRYLTTGPALAPPAARSARFRVLLAPESSSPAAIFIDDASLQQVVSDVAATPAPPPPAEEDEPLVDAVEQVGTGAEQVRLHAGGQLLPQQGESPYPVKLNEVMYDPAQSGDDAEYEWLELYNAGGELIDLGGWTLSDNNAGDTLPSFMLAPHGFAIVAASEHVHDVNPTFGGAIAIVADGRIGTGLANKGDHLLLRDSTGKLVDGVSWGDDETVLSPSAMIVPSGHSIERSPMGHDTDAANDFVDNANPSPGRGIGEPAVAGAAIERQAAGSGVVYPPSQETTEASSDLARRALVSIAAGLVALAVGLSAGLYGRQRFRQWP